jgi:hypothetical protein
LFSAPQFNPSTSGGSSTAPPFPNASPQETPQVGNGKWRRVDDGEYDRRKAAEKAEAENKAANQRVAAKIAEAAKAATEAATQADWEANLHTIPGNEDGRWDALYRSRRDDPDSYAEDGEPIWFYSD